MDNKLTNVDIVDISLDDYIFINQKKSIKQTKCKNVVDIVAKEANGLSSQSIYPSLYDGVFIVYHNIENNEVMASPINSWAELQNSGEIADGVLVINGDKRLVISTQQTSISWSSSSYLIDNPYPYKETAMNDWSGKSTTASIRNNAYSIADDNTNCAAKYCYEYSSINKNSVGIKAGQWWLPSVGEMMFIAANKNRINKALSMIQYAKELTDDIYWCSTQENASYAWCVNLSPMAIYSKCKNHPAITRAVTDFV